MKPGLGMIRFIAGTKRRASVAGINLVKSLEKDNA